MLFNVDLQIPLVFGLVPHPATWRAILCASTTSELDDSSVSSSTEVGLRIVPVPISIHLDPLKIPKVWLLEFHKIPTSLHFFFYLQR